MTLARAGMPMVRSRLRYTEGGQPKALPTRTGQSIDIAGIVSANGRVMGMMPHPERAIGP